MNKREDERLIDVGYYLSYCVEDWQGMNKLK